MMTKDKPIKWQKWKEQKSFFKYWDFLLVYVERIHLEKGPVKVLHFNFESSKKIYSKQDVTARELKKIDIQDGT